MAKIKKANNWLDEYGDGGKTKSKLTPEQINTLKESIKNQTLDSHTANVQKLNEAYKKVVATQTDPFGRPIPKRVESTVSAGQKQSTSSKAAAIIRNPMTALSYKMQGQDIPDNFEKSGNRNAYDHALDILNPTTYYDAAKRTVTAEHLRNIHNIQDLPGALGSTALDVAMIYGMGEGIVNSGPKVAMREVANPLGKKSVFNQSVNQEIQAGLASEEGQAAQTWYGRNLNKKNKPFWDAHDERLSRVWDKVDRQPIKVPTIKFEPKNAGQVRVPSTTSGYAGMVGEEGEFTALVNEPKNIRNSPEMEEAIKRQSTKLKNDRHFNNTEQDYNQHVYLNPFVGYDLQTLEHSNTFTPGIQNNVSQQYEVPTQDTAANIPFNAPQPTTPTPLKKPTAEKLTKIVPEKVTTPDTVQPQVPTKAPVKWRYELENKNGVRQSDAMDTPVEPEWFKKAKGGKINNWLDNYK